MKDHPTETRYTSMSHTFGEYGVFLPSVTWELTNTLLYRTVRKRQTVYRLSDIESISFFYGRVRNSPYRYYCRFRIHNKWNGRQVFSVFKSDVEKGNGEPYIQFALQLVEKVRAENPALQLQFGQTLTASIILIVAAISSLSIPVILHLGIGDNQATFLFSLIIIPLAGILIWGAFKHWLRKVPSGETVPQKVFPGPVQTLRNS